MPLVASVQTIGNSCAKTTADQPDFQITTYSRHPSSRPRRNVAVVASLGIHASILVWLSSLFLEIHEPPSYPHLICESNQENALEGSSPAPDPLASELAVLDSHSTASAQVELNQTSILTPDDALAAQRPKAAIHTHHEEIGQIIAEIPRRMNLAGRHAPQRQQLVAHHGGNPVSEAAVDRGLQWIATQQHSDGRWTFRLDARSPIANPGTDPSTTAATSLALLPLLGAGHTHRQGNFQSTVTRGLKYLTSRMIETRHGGDFQEGTMYGQALSAITLSEAYAMSRDETLRPSAQAAVDFICSAQHTAGGWRYRPGEPGDTTVTGWQFMAIQSARMAGLRIEPRAIQLSMRYLDSVQSDEGAKYGYRALKPAPTQTATAVGLLCRMYGGWMRSTPAVDRGSST
jgi:hypothetical protein